jgi:nucleotide-binding universal stress UspA family protein
MDLAEEGTTLHFCAVVDAVAASAGGALGAAFNIMPMLEEAEADATRACRDAVAMAHERGFAADGKVMFGRIACAIVDFAKDTQSDAIVIGAHAGAPLSRFVTGSVSRGIMRLSPVPVVVAHIDDVLAAGGPVTVAIDESPRSRAALAFALALAKVRGVEVAIETVTGATSQERRDADVLIDDAADEARAADVPSERITVVGEPVETIVNDAASRRSSMIVVGAHATMFHKNVPSKIIDRSHMPVAVVPTPS